MQAADTRYVTPYGSFELQRYPARRAEPLQAWCAADTLLVEESHKQGIVGEGVLVVNDEHGALGIALRPQALWTDSALSATALQRNLSHNDLAPIPVRWSTAKPPAGISHVVLRIPKQIPYFEYQLTALARCLPQGATLLAAGMDKHLSPHTASILERFVGPTARHRGQRKARLFSAMHDGHAANTVPASAASYFCEPLQAQLCALPNVFSREGLDIGTRYLLQQLDRLAPVATLIDLACGNGVIGLTGRYTGLAQTVHFCDESAMAIASARRNASKLFPGQDRAFFFHHGDGLLDYSGAPADLILCNPPFHLNHVVDEFAGRHLLSQCADHLLAKGRLALVANRHLDYRPTLRRSFRTVEKLAQNRKFVVWLATKS